MQSIWSVPHTQSKGKKQAPKYDFERAIKELFIHKKNKNKTLSHPFHIPQHNYYAQNQHPFPSFNQQHEIINHSKVKPAPITVFNSNLGSVSYPEKRAINIKNVSAVFQLLLPILLAILGIPFYIMVILKLINYIH